MNIHIELDLIANRVTITRESNATQYAVSNASLRRLFVACHRAGYPLQLIEHDQFATTLPKGNR